MQFDSGSLKTQYQLLPTCKSEKMERKLSSACINFVMWKENRNRPSGRARRAHFLVLHCSLVAVLAISSRDHKKQVAE